MLREDAWNILNEYTKSEGLIKHALAVEVAMKAFAKKYGGDEERWGVAGLLHDFDYEAYPAPEQHAVEGADLIILAAPVLVEHGVEVGHHLLEGLAALR